MSEAFLLWSVDVTTVVTLEIFTTSYFHRFMRFSSEWYILQRWNWRLQNIQLRKAFGLRSCSQVQLDLEPKDPSLLEIEMEFLRDHLKIH
jgi:hypothetical protein